MPRKAYTKGVSKITRSGAAILCISILSVFSSALAAEWVDLFDGKTTEGWTPRSKVIRFEVKDGALELLSKTNCWVTTDIAMRDFEAELEVLLPVDAQEVNFNSGFAYRCSGNSGKPKGYQCEIDLQRPASIYGIGLGGWLYPTKAQNPDYQKKI